jgi:hypothetical protein
MTKKIIFHSKSLKNKKDHAPSAAKNSIPRWFLDHDKYKRDENGDIKKTLYVGKDGEEKYANEVTWKSCPAILDSFIYGYFLYTPCDVEFKKDNNNYLVFQDKDFMSGVNKKTFSFCGIRGEDKYFPVPHGYENLHFTWTTNWFPQTPDGYSVLVTHPINRFDLPFLTLTGIIDSSRYINGGLLPFFIKKDFEGIVPAGTPYAQVIPLKNESWQKENLFYNEEEINSNRKKMKHEYGVDHPDHTTNYKELYWEGKTFND